MKTRFFEYIGEPILTRGTYGETLVGGYESDNDGMIHYFDSTFGEFTWGSIELSLQHGLWKEVSEDKSRSIIWNAEAKKYEVYDADGNILAFSPNLIGAECRF